MEMNDNEIDKLQRQIDALSYRLLLVEEEVERLTRIRSTRTDGMPNPSDTEESWI